MKIEGQVSVVFMFNVRDQHLKVVVFISNVTKPITGRTAIKVKLICIPFIIKIKGKENERENNVHCGKN